MDFTHLPEALPAVVIQRGFLVKMNSDRELPCIYLERKYKERVCLLSQLQHNHDSVRGTAGKAHPVFLLSSWLW